MIGVLIPYREGTTTAFTLFLKFIITDLFTFCKFFIVSSE